MAQTMRQFFCERTNERRERAKKATNPNKSNTWSTWNWQAKWTLCPDWFKSQLKLCLCLFRSRSRRSLCHRSLVRAKYEISSIDQIQIMMITLCFSFYCWRSILINKQVFFSFQFRYLFLAYCLCRQKTLNKHVFFYRRLNEMILV